MATLAIYARSSYALALPHILMYSIKKSVDVVSIADKMDIAPYLL